MQKQLVTLLVIMLVGAGSAAAATAPPRNTVPPTISGTARQGEVLTANAGSWSGTQPMTFAYQWRRCDAKGASCSNISGATAKTYTVTSADVGNALRVRVRATNSARSATATSTFRTVVETPAPKSVSLDAGQVTVVYGRAVSLFGSVGNSQAGDTVTITAQRLSPFSENVETVATVPVAADGSFNIAVRPVTRTLYRASTGQSTSTTVSIKVRPRLSLRRIGSHRFSLTATAARSFAGRYAVLQRWIPRQHRWVSVRRVVFTRAIAGASPNITSRAVFRARFGGARIRAYVQQSQLTAAYAPSVSNVASA